MWGVVATQDFKTPAGVVKRGQLGLAESTGDTIVISWHRPYEFIKTELICFTSTSYDVIWDDENEKWVLLKDEFPKSRKINCLYFN